MGDKRFGDERGALAQSVGPGCRVEVKPSEESEEGVIVLRQGDSSKSESCQEL